MQGDIKVKSYTTCSTNFLNGLPCDDTSFSRLVHLKELGKRLEKLENLAAILHHALRRQDSIPYNYLAQTSEATHIYLQT